MGDGDSKTELSEIVTNGTTSREKDAETNNVVKKEEDNGVKEMEEDGNEENNVEVEKEEKMNEANEEKANGVKPEPNEGKTEAMDEEKMEEDIRAENVDAKEEQMGENKENEDDGKDEETNTKEEKEVEKENGRHSEEEKEGEMQSEEENEEEKQSEVVKGKSSNKRSRGKSVVDKKKIEVTTPVSERPVRERKSVERLVATIEKDSSKKIHIEKGHGTPLRDIPNVAYKLSRKKNDEIFKSLHNILFGRGKAALVKHNISRFSGFVWHGEEEKQRLKVKEKFDKCVKEKLVEFCDVLDIPISKAKKEDVVGKLLDFLEAPHATTTVLLAEEDQGKKRKRPSKGSVKSSNKRVKGQKSSGDDESEGNKEEEEIENDSGERSDGVNFTLSDSDVDKDETESKFEDDVVVEEKKRLGKSNVQTKVKSCKLESSVKATNKRTPIKQMKSSGDKTPKVFSRKKKSEEPEIEKGLASKKSSTEEKSGKKAVKGKEKPKEDKLKPSDDKLREAICDILKEVDFNTATFTDILNQLANKFKTDLNARRSSIKLMIQDELTKLADEVDDDQNNDDNDGDDGIAEQVEA